MVHSFARSQVIQGRIASSFIGKLKSSMLQKELGAGWAAKGCVAPSANLGAQGFTCPCWLLPDRLSFFFFIAVPSLSHFLLLLSSFLPLSFLLPFLSLSLSLLFFFFLLLNHICSLSLSLPPPSPLRFLLFSLPFFSYSYFIHFSFRESGEKKTMHTVPKRTMA